MTRIFLAALCTTLAAIAQQPPISNANFQNASGAAGLEPAVRAAIARQPGPAWIGYAVAKISGDSQSCCWNDGGRGCGLEGNRNANVQVARTGPVQLEGPAHVAILLRAEAGKVGKIRTFTVDCPLDAGGLPFYWLSNVKPADSVAMLLRQATEEATDSAVHAVAMHAAPEAAAALDKLASNSPSEKVRKSAIFWLATSRGKQGYQSVARLSREDPSDKVREHAVFALTQSPEPEAMAAVIRVAKEDKVPHVRGQALFWLAQRASKQQASGAINEALEKDPDTEVKKKAVFALTQMPKDEGVPMLIQVARSNSNAAVRKQAMFWLGQSKDARALKFFEDVLTK
jgi:HEAT repeat protein